MCHVGQLDDCYLENPRVFFGFLWHFHFSFGKNMKDSEMF